MDETNFLNQINLRRFFIGLIFLFSGILVVTYFTEHTGKTKVEAVVVMPATEDSGHNNDAYDVSNKNTLDR